MNKDVFTFKDENGKIKVYTNFEKLLPEHQEQMKVIDLVYETKYFIGMHNNKNNLTPKNKRSCRFCGKSYPEVTFKKIAHIVPELLGNKSLVSDYECDNCNWKFGQFENDLANYFGLFRTFAHIEGKKGLPKFKSADKAIKIELAKDFIFDVRYKNLQKNIEYEIEDKILKIKCKSNPYIPLNVYKSLLKSALSFVDESDLKYLSKTFEFLNDEQFKVSNNENFIITIHRYFVPGDVKTPPFIIYYRKWEHRKDYEAPSMAFVFYVKNIIIQLFIPYHSEDLFFYEDNKEKERKIFIIPPLVSADWINKNGTPFSRVENLNDKNKLTDVVQNSWFKLI